MNIISQRVQEMNFSQTFVMSNKARELKAKGHDVISLTLGEPDFNVPTAIQEAAIDAIHKNFSKYSPVPGFLETREAVCKKLKRDNNLIYQPSQICISTGAKQAIFNVLAAITNPGDEIIIPTPYWVSYAEMIRLLGGIPISIHTTVESDFKISVSQLEDTITERTKAILYSSPCNPSGSFYTQQDLKEISDCLKKHPSVLVISDEIYEYLVYEDEPFSIAQIEGMQERTAVINGLSKGFAMTGWRLGYSACPEWLAKAVEMIQGQVTSGTNTVAQQAAITALHMSPNEPEIAEMKAAFNARRKLMYDLLQKIPGLQVSYPKSAFYFFPDVSAFFGKSFNNQVISSGDDFSMGLLENKFVGSVGGDSFGNTNCIRFSYATSENLIIEGMKRLSDFITELS